MCTRGRRAGGQGTGRCMHEREDSVFNDIHIDDNVCPCRLFEVVAISNTQSDKFA